jgi:hypothetical protein
VPIDIYVIRLINGVFLLLILVMLVAASKILAAKAGISIHIDLPTLPACLPWFSRCLRSHFVELDFLNYYALRNILILDIYGTTTLIVACVFDHKTSPMTMHLS